MSDIEIKPFTPQWSGQAAKLVLSIQRDEFGVPISIADQPDLGDIPGVYQQGKGNFWIALDGSALVGTIALLDIGAGQAALRKMFVRANQRGKGVAAQLLDVLLRWSGERRIWEIFLGTTEHFRASHRFYEGSGFVQIDVRDLPASFPRMAVDTKFYRYLFAS